MIYCDPHPHKTMVMGYRGITTWTEELNQEFVDKLAGMDFDSLSDRDKEAYTMYQEYIQQWNKGINPLQDRGFFYCPYIPLKEAS